MNDPKITPQPKDAMTNLQLVTRWDDLPLVLTVEAAAKVAGVGCRAIYDMARTKGFPAVRFGKSIRIPRDAFRQWINSRAS